MYLDNTQELNQTKLTTGDNSQYYGLRDQILILREQHGLSLRMIANELHTSIDYVIEVIEGEL